MSSQSDVVLITGAGGGIGQETVLQYLRAGYRVVAADRADPREVLISSGADPCILATMAADITVEDDVTRMIAHTISVFGRIDILVCCAAVIIPEHFTEISLASWNQVLDVNLTGTFLTVQQALKPMAAAQRGSIVLVSSIAGRRMSVANGAHYTCSKYALIGLTRHLAAELGGTGIRINCVCPGTTATPGTLANYDQETLRRIQGSIPLGRFAEPADIAEVIRFVASGAARHMHGAIVDVNGGMY